MQEPGHCRHRAEQRQHRERGQLSSTLVNTIREGLQMHLFEGGTMVSLSQVQLQLHSALLLRRLRNRPPFEPITAGGIVILDANFLCKTNVRND